MIGSFVLATRTCYRADSSLAGGYHFAYSPDSTVCTTTYKSRADVIVWKETYTYSNGLKAKSTLFDAKDSAIETTTYTYGSSSELIGEETRLANGSLTLYTTIEYASGNPIKKSFFSADSSLVYYIAFTHDASRRKTAETLHYSNGQLALTKTFSYGKYGVSLEQKLNEAGVMTGWYLYEYLPFHFLVAH